MKHALLICGAMVAAAPVAGQGLTNQGAVLSIQSGAQVAVVGDVTVSSGGTIDNAGTLSLTGNWNNNTSGGVLTPATGLVQLTGAAAQQIGGTTATTFHSLDVSAATGPVQLATDMAVGNAGGRLALGATQVQLNSRTVTLNNGAASALSQTTGRLVAETTPAAGYGRLVWVIGANTGTYTVPMGTSTSPVSLSAAITGAGSSNGSLSFTTYATPANNQPLPAGVTSLQGDANYALDRFWIVTPANYTITPTATLTLGYQEGEWATSPNTITESRLRLQRWNGSNWEPSQGSVQVSGNALTSDAQNTYGIFTAADLTRPLPVTLTRFTAAAQAANAELRWTTATEANNQGFGVEASRNGVQFQELQFVPSRQPNSTSPQQYAYQHAGAGHQAPVWYYRLRQQDLNGTVTYSAVQTVRFNAQAPALMVAPNPSAGRFTATVYAPAAQAATLQLHDALGRLVSQQPAALLPGNNPVAFGAAERLPAGWYLLSTQVGGHTLRTRLVVE